MIRKKEKMEFKKSLENKFLLNLMELSFTRNKRKREKIIKRNKRMAGGLEDFKGWPGRKISFWNGEAFGWHSKIDREIRKLIKKELSFLKGKTLDLGSGSYGYIHSVALDFSLRMLLINEMKNKVLGDLEEGLPFKDGSFDSVALVFTVNYIKKINNLIKEIKRVLKKKGKVMVVQSEQVHEWQRRHYENDLKEKEIKRILRENGFKMNSYRKRKNNQEVVFIKGRKR